MKITEQPGLRTKHGHLITHAVHPDCQHCLDQAERAASFMLVTGSTGGTATADIAGGGLAHGAKIKRDQTYFGPDAFKDDDR